MENLSKLKFQKFLQNKKSSFGSFFSAFRETVQGKGKDVDALNIAKSVLAEKINEICDF